MLPLGVSTASVATVDSMMVWGLIRPRPGVENYSWKGNKIDGLTGCVNSKPDCSIMLS